MPAGISVLSAAIARAVVLAGVTALVLQPAVPANAQTNLLAPGNPAATVDPSQVMPAWSHWVWEGHGKAQRLPQNGNSVAAVLLNDGPAKQAVFQYVNLRACAYELTAEVAAEEVITAPEGRGATVHMAMDSGQPGVTFDLYKTGASGWRTLQLNYTVAAATRGVVYFFNYGHGVLGVRNVRLVERPGCRADRPDGFTLATEETEPFNFVTPVSVGDASLQGYCADQKFKAHPVCRRPPIQPAPSPIARTLETFEKSASVFAGLQRITSDRALDGRGSGILKRGAYAAATPSSGLATDWTSYDWLRFDVHNTSDKPVQVYVELNDDKTDGYWSRVNWTTAAAPGRSTLDVPLSVPVGERSVVGDRRNLNLAAIRRLVLTVADGDLVIDNVRLEAHERFKTVFPELLKFDFLPGNGLPYPEFTPVTAGTMYRENRGFGFSSGTRIGRSEDRRHPVGLLRDWVSIVNGGFEIDLPNGRYRVWLMAEDAGYWEYFPSYTRRQISVQGLDVEQQDFPYSDFERRFWRNADREDLPGDDIWQNYIVPRYRPLVTTATVSGGRLRLGFNGFTDPLAVPISALIVFPESKAAEGEAFIGELMARLKSDFDRETKQVIPAVQHGASAATAVPQVLAGDLTVYRQPVSTITHASDRPTAVDPGTPLQLVLPANLAEIATIGLRPQKDLSLTSLRVDIEDVAVAAYVERHKIERMVQDGSIFKTAPRVLDPLSPSTARPYAFKAKAARGIWFEVSAKAGAKAGMKRGRVTFGFDDGREASIPLEIDLKFWALPDADVAIGYLGSATRYPLASYPELEQRRQRELADGLAIQRRSGMTAVSGGLGGVRLLNYDLGRPTADVGAFRKTLGIVAQHRFAELLSYDGSSIEGLNTSAVVDTMPLYARPYVTVLRDVLDVIERETAAVRGAVLVHSIADEPAPSSIEGVLQVARAFKQAKRSVRTAAFTSFTQGRSDPRAKLAGEVDRLYLTQHSEDAIKTVIARGSQCSLYNQQGRYFRGAYLFKMRALGCYGHMQFAFHAVHGDHWYDLDGRESDMVAVFAHPDGKLRPSRDHMVYRSGVTDYRYLMLLDALAVRSPKHPAAPAASRFLQGVLQRMRVADAGGWDDAALDQVRADTIRHIEAFASSR